MTNYMKGYRIEVHTIEGLEGHPFKEVRFFGTTSHPEVPLYVGYFHDGELSEALFTKMCMYGAIIFDIVNPVRFGQDEPFRVKYEDERLISVVWDDNTDKWEYLEQIHGHLTPQNMNRHLKDIGVPSLRQVFP